MAKTIISAFDQFASNLEITGRQTSLVAHRRANVVKEITKELTLHPEGSKVTGSWDRNTLTRYLSEGDVDAMVILNYGAHKDWDTADGTIKALDRFKAILDKAYLDIPKRRDRNCISLQFSEFRLDVVPAFKCDDGTYKIPDSVRRQWVRTDPFAFATKITEINHTMGGRFVPLIKMVKAWNREVGWPIRSFHLECIMQQRYRSYTQGYSYSSMLKQFFADLPGYLDSPCYEPVTYDRVDTYLDNNAQTTRRSIAIAKATAAAHAAREAHAYEDKDVAKAIGLWKALMGEFFPTYD